MVLFIGIPWKQSMSVCRRIWSIRDIRIWTPVQPSGTVRDHGGIARRSGHAAGSIDSWWNVPHGRRWYRDENNATHTQLFRVSREFVNQLFGEKTKDHEDEKSYASLFEQRDAAFYFYFILHYSYMGQYHIKWNCLSYKAWNWRSKPKNYREVCIFCIINTNFVSNIIIFYTPSNFIEDNYINPEDINITFKSKRNLIHIYLESMESSFANEENGGAFSVNLIPCLTKLAHENVDFSGSQTKLNGARPFFGATWTAGGMFAQSAGVPLNEFVIKSTFHSQNSFYQGLVTLGDILLKNGYQQTFLLGSRSGFAAKNRGLY